MRLLLVYFSGASSTGKVAQMMEQLLLNQAKVTRLSVEKFLAAEIDLTVYSGIILGTPVYHGAPAKLVMTLIDRLPLQKRMMPIFLYNTYALWSCNTNRIMARALLAKNCLICLDRGYRSPASDGSLILPGIKRFSTFEKNLAMAVEQDLNLFLRRLKRPVQGYFPRFHLSSFLNAPNKFIGQGYTFKIYLHQNRCSRCLKCIRDCPYQAIRKIENNYPMIDRKNCQNCYRCIHHCPVQALSLGKRQVVKKQLNK